MGVDAMATIAVGTWVDRNKLKCDLEDLWLNNSPLLEYIHNFYEEDDNIFIGENLVQFSWNDAIKKDINLTILSQSEKTALNNVANVFADIINDDVNNYKLSTHLIAWMW